ncbi:(deoxy)nucleoside triphosphate pyrophosphohydrolase [Arcticibacter eurypsychrophilus]|uniref:(deoxy)nucleoside triphosphate pyrophosphohydrolase n=1 Tax=Arcticibacter eurypsychrophilus TaxID=1434752 RepID=UPI00084DE42E|nr:(deoxy)nucleoside triphosphate pyrophosphohydrolase [Arcticibacter eurypsychrophilus]
MVLDVVCALIIDKQGKVLAARRSKSMDLPGKWEFPGGKVEPFERAEESVIREIKEELDIVIEISKAGPAHLHHYEKKTIRLIPFICKQLSGTISLKEHESFGWFTTEQLRTLVWAEADIPILNDYINSLS